MRRGKLQTLLGLVGLTLLLSSCAPISSVTVGRTWGHSHHGHDQVGPPSHAPAHGYRAKHQGSHGSGEIDLVFDSALGVYLVVGVPDRYYWNGHYLRIEGGQWAASVELKVVSARGKSG